MPSWVVRKYQEGDEQGISNLLMVVAGHSHSDSIWNWRYRKNPFGSIAGVAESNGEIVGYMGLIAKPLKVMNKEIRGCEAVSLVVHPNFRRQGMFLAIGRYIMGEAEKQGLGICYGFPNVPAYGGHLKYGWFDAGRLPIFVKFVSVSSLRTDRVKDFLSKTWLKPLANFLDKRIFSFILRILLFLYNGYCRVAYRLSDKLDGVKVSSIKCFDERFDDLWKAASKGRKVMVVRNRQYLNWRYVEKPMALSSYVMFAAEKNDEVSGFIVLLCVKLDGMKYGFIVDLLTVPNDSATVKALISRALTYFKEQKVDLITCWMSGDTTCQRILRSFAFHLGKPEMFIARVNSVDMTIFRPILQNIQNWYLTLGESDFDITF